MAGSYSILDLPKEERPRERLQKNGPESISSAELIAIVLGSGMQGTPVLQLAHEILAHFGNLQKLSEATVEELCQIRGVGPAKAVQLKACFNLGLRAARFTSEAKYRVESPLHAYHLIKEDLEREKKELFAAILLDTKGFVICHPIVAMGTLSQTLIHPREVFYPAIRHKAASMVLAHNHPSGDPTPSKQDYEVTEALVNAGKLIGIPVNDHIIIGDNSYISLRQKGFCF